MKINLDMRIKGAIKKPSIVFVSVWFLFFFMSGRNIQAGEKPKPKHIPTAAIIEFSLLEIKEKLDKTLQKNEKLRMENAVLRKDMSYLRRVLESLAVEKSQLSGKPLSFYYLDEPKYSKNLVDLQRREQRTRVLIDHFERDVNQLNEEIRMIERKLDAQEHSAKQKLLTKSKENNKANMARLRNKVKKLEHSSKGPIKKIEALKVQNMALKHEVRDLENSVYTLK